MAICTTVGRSDLARARVMVETLRRQDPDADVTVLLLDGDSAAVEPVAGASMLGLGELLGDTAAGLLAVVDPPAALVLAVLPALAQRLLERGADSVLYVGAGARVLGSLGDVRELARSHELVLVSRAAGELDDALEAFAGIERGTYSDALIGIGAAAIGSGLLSAWPRYFADAADRGAAAAAAWLDSLPGRSGDVAIVRDPGLGADAWTLAARPLGGEAEEELTAGGARVRLLDLGGLDPERPAELFDGEDRANLSAAPGLADAVQAHAQELLAAGWKHDRLHAPPFEALPGGPRLTPTVRTLALEAIRAGAIERSPFTDAGRSEFLAYLNEPGSRGAAAGLSRLHVAIWERRDDLRSAYPHLDGPDGAGLAGWLCVHGAEQEGLVPEVLPQVSELAFRDPRGEQAGEVWGVNVAGFFSAELGIGEAARLLIAGLDAGSVPALPIQGRLLPSSRRGVAFPAASPDDAAYPITIVCINGDGIPVFAREAGRGFFEGRYTIALWWWEVGRPPASWSAAYEFVDEVWVASRHIYEAISPVSPVPVVPMLLPVLEPKVAPVTRVQLGLPEDRFLFLFVHDYHSVAARKNPIGLIEAFARAFSPGEGPCLVIKSINADKWPEEHERVRQAAARHADVELIDEYVSAGEKNAMIAACDCYVSLHRAEGFGLTVAEAMLLERPVIATGYGGVLEFMDAENSYLVRWNEAPVGEGAYPYPADGVWAEPDLDHAAALMREVVAEPDAARARGHRAARDVRSGHSAALAGERMALRLALIRDQRGFDEGAVNLAQLPAAVDRASIQASIGRVPAPGWEGARLGRLKEFAYRPLVNWTRAYVRHQKRVDGELLETMADLDERLRAVAATLHDEQWAARAEALSLLRRLGAEAQSRPVRPDNMAGS